MSEPDSDPEFSETEIGESMAEERRDDRKDITYPTPPEEL